MIPLFVRTANGIKEALADAAGRLHTLAHGADVGGNSLPLLTDSLGRQITTFAAPIEQRNAVGALAANAVYTSPVLDLGPAATRQHTLILAYRQGQVSTGDGFRVEFSDDNLTWYFAAPNVAGSSGVANGVIAGNLLAAHQARVIARYARAVYTNGPTAQTTLSVMLTVLAGV